MVRVGDLTDQIGKPGPRPFLLCRVCGGEYSADAGDYFAAEPETVLRCCRKPMVLATKQTVYREVMR